MEINYLKSMEAGKMKFILKIFKEGQQNYYGKDQIIFLIIMKDNTISISFLCS
jgi:hypothetical protein